MEDPIRPTHLFLIGSHASKAMSPELWTSVLARLGSRWTYEAWDVAAGAAMEPVRTRLLEQDVIGANVTMPHKQWAAGVADKVTEDVRLSGACNLLVRCGGTLEGHNTDISAAAVLLGGQYQRNVLMMGAGGAARAALIALKGKAGSVTIADRDAHAAEDLLGVAYGLGMNAQAVPWERAQGAASDASLIVNATPIGKARSDRAVWGDGPLAADATVYDFVYADHVTASIARARELGARGIDGWDHLFEQAAAMIPILGLSQRAGPLLEDTLTVFGTEHGLR